MRPLAYNFCEASKAGQTTMTSATIFDNTLVKDQPALAVTLVDNHDPAAAIISNPLLEPCGFKPLGLAPDPAASDATLAFSYADY